MTAPALRLAPTAPPTLSDINRQAAEMRRARAAEFLAAIIDLQEMAGEIADREAGYPVGVASVAQCLLAPLHTAEMNLRRQTEAELWRNRHKRIAPPSPPLWRGDD